MRLSEYEAKTKICVFDPIHADIRMNCVASSCMAWRWVEIHQLSKKIPHPASEEEIARYWEKEGLPAPERPAGVPENYVFEVYAHDAYCEEPMKSQRKGYCGLAGRTE